MNTSERKIGPLLRSLASGDGNRPFFSEFVSPDSCGNWEAVCHHEIAHECVLLRLNRTPHSSHSFIGIGDCKGG